MAGVVVGLSRSSHYLVVLALGCSSLTSVIEGPLVVRRHGRGDSGTGPHHVGAALRRELEPRLLERFELDGWSLSCGNSFTITLNAQRSGCQVSEVVDVVGDYLRQRHADDRIVILMGLWAAPAL